MTEPTQQPEQPQYGAYAPQPAMEPPAPQQQKPQMDIPTYIRMMPRNMKIGMAAALAIILAIILTTTVASAVMDRRDAALHPSTHLITSCSKLMDGYPDPEKMADSEAQVYSVMSNDSTSKASVKSVPSVDRRMFDCAAKALSIPETVQTEMLTGDSEGDMTWGHAHVTWEYIGDALWIDVNDVR